MNAMDTIELFESANTPVLIGSLLSLLDGISTKTAEKLVSICLTRSIKALIHTPILAWKLTATLSQAIPKCTNIFLLKNSTHLDKIYEDAFIGISRDLELSSAHFFKHLQKVSLAKILILSYGDFSLKLIQIRGYHQIKASTFSTLLAFLSRFQTSILTYNSEPTISGLRGALDIILCITKILSQIQRCTQMRSFLRSRAIEIRTACFGILIAATYVSTYMSENQLTHLVGSVASLFSLVIFSLEGKSLRYEAGAELMRLFTVFNYLAMSSLFEDVELSILDGYTVISTIGTMLGVGSSAFCIDFWKDHPVIGNIRFSKFLHRFAYTCSLFLASCVKQILSFCTELIEYGTSADDQVTSLRSEPYPILLYPVVGISELICLSSKIFLKKFTATANFKDLVVIFKHFACACSIFSSMNFGLLNNLKIIIYWPVVQLFTVPPDVISLISPSLYQVIVSLLSTTSLTLPIDNRIYNERFYSFTTLISSLYRDLIGTLPKKRDCDRHSCSMEAAVESARVFRELCRCGQARLLVAYTAVLQDAGCPLLTDIIIACFRIVLLYACNLHKSITICEDPPEDTDISLGFLHTHLQSKRIYHETELYVLILEGLTDLSLTPINERLSTVLPLTIYFLKIASTDRLLSSEHIRRLEICQGALNIALLPVTPQSYLYGINVSPDLMLQYGITERIEISLENFANMVGGTCISEPILKQDRPALLPYLPVICIDGCAELTSNEENEYKALPSESLVSTEMNDAPATPCSTTTASLPSVQSTQKPYVPHISNVAMGLTSSNERPTQAQEQTAELITLNLDSSEDGDD